MYETSSDQSRLCMEFPHSSLSNQGHKRLVIFVQEEPIEVRVRQFVTNMMPQKKDTKLVQTKARLQTYPQDVIFQDACNRLCVLDAFLRNDGEIADGNSIIGHEVVQ